MFFLKLQFIKITIHSEVGDLEKKESPVLSLPVEDPWSLESCNGSVSSFPISIDN